jgi:hypothetical protein
VIVLWNEKFNWYKEQIVEIKHSLEGNSVKFAPKQWHVKEIERSITVERILR